MKEEKEHERGGKHCKEGKNKNTGKKGLYKHEGRREREEKVQKFK